MPFTDVLKTGGLKGGEDKARRHEAQLNSDCTKGEGTKNNPRLPPFVCQPVPQRGCKIPDRLHNVWPYRCQECSADL